MAQTIKLKRSANTTLTSGQGIPTTSDLALGEVAINTYHGTMYIKKNDGTDAIVEIGGASSGALPLTGGTLTGALSGTTASFSGALSSAAITTSYGLSLTNGSTNFLLYNNANENLLYMRDTTNSQMITTWYTDKFQVDKDLQVTGIVKHADGTVAAPSITFTDDTNTGIYSSGADTVDIATGGVRRAFFNNAGITSVSNVYTASNGDFRNYGGVWEASTGLTGNGFSFVNSIDGTAATISSTGNAVFSGTISSGAITIPDYVIHSGNTNTKFGFPSANIINFTTNGTERLALAGSYTVFNESGADVDFRVEAVNSTHALFVQGSDGNVGIGTTAPTDKLDVAGALRLTANISFDANKSGRIYKASNHGLAFHGVTGSANDFALFNPAGQLMVVNPTGTNNLSLVPAAGHNVGIGTTTPLQKFVVANATNGQGLEIVPGTTNTLQSYNRAASVYLPLNIDVLDFKFRVNNGSEAMRITSAGNVGIGNSAPTSYNGYKILHIGNATTSNTGLLKFGTGSTADGPELYASGTSLRMNTSGSVNVLNLVGSNVGIGTTNPTSHINTGSFFKPDSNGKLLTLNGGANGSFIMLESSTTTDNDQIGGIYWSRTQGQGDAHKQVAGIDVIQAAYAPNNTLEGGTLRFFTKGSGSGTNTSRMVINPDGNVGIGTSSPASNLHIKTSVDNSVAQGLVIERSANSDKGYINYNGGGFQFRSTVGDPIVFGETDAEHMRILPDGNVGIGTTAPGFKLDVAGTARFTADVYAENHIYTQRIRHNGDVDNYIGFGTDIQSFVTGNSTRAQFSNTLVRFNQEGLNQDFQVFGQNDDNLFYADASTDRIGIGTASPDAKLRIDQDAAATGLKVTGGSGGVNIAQFIRDVGGNASVNINASGADPQIQFVSAGNTFALGVNSNTFEIADNSSLGANTRFSITNTGNVGIGTSSPLATLDVVRGGTTGLSSVNARTALLVQNNLSNGTVISINAKNTGYSGIFFGDQDSESKCQIQYDHTSDKLKFLTNGGGYNPLTLSGQNVGIGTATPATTLDITTTGVQGLIINQDTGSASVSSRLFFKDSTRTNLIMNVNGLLEFRTDATIGSTSGARRLWVSPTLVETSVPLRIEECQIDTTTTSTTATTLAQIDTFTAATFRSARYTIQATNSTDSTYHITEVLLIHDGTNAYITEYGTMFTGSSEGTISADIAAGNVRLLVTPASTDTIAWKVVRHSILV
jgi:hypothetical protein